MYTVEQYKPEIRLISNIDGVVGVYPDYETFLEGLNYFFVEQHVVTTFKDWPSSWYNFIKFGETFPRYIVRDKFGSVFTPTEILNDISKSRRSEPNPNKWYNKKHDFIYRETPVPFTGKRIRGFYIWYKKPRTTQELRWNEAHGEYSRGKRRKGYLPTAWDDYPRGDHRERKNWKRRRKTQWKQNTVGTYK
ncbi:MAG: hypothetical protein V3W20_07130 [Candidatus Neomarinimicrobiota bacterium]